VEVRFVPDNPDHLTAMFEALSDAEELHPANTADEEGDFYFNAPEVQGNLAVGSMSELQISPQQNGQADDEDSDGKMDM